MSSNTSTELQKEFELERMILFSDAVFAIAITLLIIEIKFPEIEKGATTKQVFDAFRPVLIRFAGFMLSFFFIGLMWSRHLKICKYLRSYDNGVIFFNLILLFFIVCFPFTASGLTEHINPHFYLPIFIYIGNILLVSFAQFALCYYIFSLKPQLSIIGEDKHKKYMVLQTKYSSLTIATVFVAALCLYLLFPGDSRSVVYGFYALPIMVVFTRRRLEKYKPDGRKEFSLFYLLKMIVARVRRKA